MPGRATAIALLLGLGACTTREVPEVLGDQPEALPVAQRSDKPTIPAVRTGELMLRRTRCYGHCPAYTIFVGLDGRVFYHGRHYANLRGLHTGWVQSDAVRGIFETAIADGYLDTRHEYSANITDNPTAFTQMVVGDRRHFVRNYANAAPAAVSRLQTEIDGLLGEVRWDRSPQLDPPDPSSCEVLGRAIERRCDDVLALTATGGDCMHWLHVWSGLASGPHATTPEKRRADEEQRHRCARHLQSLAATAVPATDPMPAPTLGPKCRAWFSQYPERCRASLHQGEPDSGCRGTQETTAHVLGVLQEPELEPQPRGRISEYDCDTYTR